jgi:hypothetical protein
MPGRRSTGNPPYFCRPTKRPWLSRTSWAAMYLLRRESMVVAAAPCVGSVASLHCPSAVAVARALTRPPTSPAAASRAASPRQSGRAARGEGLCEDAWGRGTVTLAEPAAAEPCIRPQLTASRDSALATSWPTCRFGRREVGPHRDHLAAVNGNDAPKSRHTRHAPAYD